MSSSYVSVKTSPGDLIGKASQIVGAGDDYVQTVNGIISDIDGWEQNPDLGNDSFHAEFIKSYTKVPDGGDKPSNELVKQNMKAAGAATSKAGQTVVNAMIAYMGSDAENATKITNAGPGTLA